MPPRSVLLLRRVGQLAQKLQQRRFHFSGRMLRLLAVLLALELEWQSALVLEPLRLPVKKPC